MEEKIQEVREAILEKVVQISNKYDNIILEHATGTGKTKLALEISKGDKVLIVYKESTHKNNIIGEINKFNFPIDNYSFVTYRSLSKIKGDFDYIICDEAHGLTPKNLPFLLKLQGKKRFLSANLTKSKFQLLEDFKAYRYTITLEDAVNLGLIPTPTVKIHWVKLTEKLMPFTQVIGEPKRKITLSYPDYLKNKNLFNIELKVLCTEKEHYQILEANYKKAQEKIEYYFKLYNETMDYDWITKAKRLKGVRNFLGLNRKKFIAEFKFNYSNKLFQSLKGKKLFFTNSIENAKTVDSLSINSKTEKKENEKNILDFKNGDIDRLVAISMLKESHNIPKLDHVILQQTNVSSVTDFIQVQGRALRDDGTILHLILLKNTLDEDILNNLVEKNLIKIE